MYNENIRKVEEQMRKRNIISFKKLVDDNKQELKSDMKAMERIEAKIDKKHSKR
jgi:Fur-regulated basic protein B